jgi:hypothetical protein
MSETVASILVDVLEKIGVKHLIAKSKPCRWGCILLHCRSSAGGPERHLPQCNDSVAIGG